MNVIQAKYVEPNPQIRVPKMRIYHKGITKTYKIPGNISGEELFIFILDKYIKHLRMMEWEQQYDGPYSIGKLKNGDYVAVFHDGRMK